MFSANTANLHPHSYIKRPLSLPSPFPELPSSLPSPDLRCAGDSHRFITMPGRWSYAPLRGVNVELGCLSSLSSLSSGENCKHGDLLAALYVTALMLAATPCSSSFRQRGRCLLSTVFFREYHRRQAWLTHYTYAAFVSLRVSRPQCLRIYSVF